MDGCHAIARIMFPVLYILILGQPTLVSRILDGMLE